MASYLDARAHQGRWLVRIEDIDTPRVEPGADTLILSQLQALGMRWDAPPAWQSQRLALYQAAFDQLQQRGLVYGCACTRQQLRNRAYPGTCRNGIEPGRQVRAWRFRVSPGLLHFNDRWLGAQQQDVEADVGDFIIKRADGLWAYQFVVVVDDLDGCPGVAALGVGDFRLVTFPAELTVEIGLGLKERSPHPLTFVSGYTNGYLYYAPTAAQAENRGRAQEDSDCLLAPEWQALFEETALRLLAR